MQVCSSSDFGNLHFDVKTINTLKFDTSTQLKSLLKDHVLATIGSYVPTKESTNMIELDDVPF